MHHSQIVLVSKLPQLGVIQATHVTCVMPFMCQSGVPERYLFVDDLRLCVGREKNKRLSACIGSILVSTAVGQQVVFPLCAALSSLCTTALHAASCLCDHNWHLGM